MDFPVSLSERAFFVTLNALIPRLVEEYGLQANPVELIGGLHDVVKGLKQMQSHGVSAKKLVYKIA